MSFLVLRFKRGLAVVLFLLAWETVPRLGFVDSALLPPLSVATVALFKLLVSGALFVHLWASFSRAFLGFALGVIIGIPLGVALAWFKSFELYVEPLLQLFRQTNPLALLPVFLLFFGIGLASKVAILFWVCLWTVLLSTINGVKNVDPLLVKAARSMGISKIALLKKVVVPAAVPSIFTGAKLSATDSILVLVAAEMVGANSGIGFLVSNSQYTFKIPTMYAAIIVLALWGLALNYLLVWAEKSITRWKPEIQV